MAALAITTDSRTFEETLERARLGSDEAWHDIYTTYSGLVSGYLRSRGASDPDDLTGEVFLNVARSIHRFAGDESKFRSWIFVIAHRLLIDARRRQSRRPEQAVLNHDAAGGDVEHEALEQLAVVQMRKVFELLTDDQQQVLGLRIIADLSLEETASALGKRVGAVKALQRRGLTAVRNKIEQGSLSL